MSDIEVGADIASAVADVAYDPATAPSRVARWTWFQVGEDVARGPPALVAVAVRVIA